MKKSKKEVEDEIFNRFVVLGNKHNDNMKQIATSICLDRTTFVEFVNELGVNVFDYFHQITNSTDKELSLLLTHDKKQEFDMRLNDINVQQLLTKQ